LPELPSIVPPEKWVVLCFVTLIKMPNPHH
jgi:hypothetical protein